MLVDRAARLKVLPGHFWEARFGFNLAAEAGVGTLPDRSGVLNRIGIHIYFARNGPQTK